MADANKLTSILNAKDVNGNCFSCGASPEWQTAESLLQFTPGDGETMSLGNGIPVFTLVCPNCGFIKLHASTILDP